MDINKVSSIYDYLIKMQEMAIAINNIILEEEEKDIEYLMQLNTFQSQLMLFSSATQSLCIKGLVRAKK